MDFLRRRWPALAVGGAAVGLTAILLWPVQAHAAVSRCAVGPRRLTMAQRKALARKWGKKRGIPPSWILATIKIESGGDACKLGDWVYPPVGPPYPRSYGLMQFNTKAHPELMARWGIEPDDLLDPDTAVMAGSYILAREHQRILRVLGTRQPPAPIGEIVQLGYKGHMAKILSQLRDGTFDPASIHGAAVRARRSSALVEAEALV